MYVNEEVERIKKELAMAYLRLYLGLCQVIFKKTTKI
jgi:hypothetical protein